MPRRYARRKSRWFLPGLTGLAVVALAAWGVTALPHSALRVISSADSSKVALTAVASGPVVSGAGAGKCLDDNRDSAAAGAVVQVWDCNGGPAQAWTLESDGTVRLNGMCLDLYRGGTANGSRVQLWTCNGYFNQQWRAGAGGTLVDPASGKCLDDPGSRTAEGAALELYTCNGGANQKWTFTGGRTPVVTTPITKPAPTSKPTPAPTGSSGTILTSVPNYLGVHDPSRIIDEDGNFYFWGTGGGGWWTKNDGRTWQSLPNVFPHGFPAEMAATVPNNSGLWAPDVIWNSNSHVYDMYYAVAIWGSNTHSAIGLITSPSLDPQSPDYHWTDRGIVIQHTVTYGQFSAIDPCPFFDARGNMWMSFGSGYGSFPNTSLNVIELNKDTGLREGTSDFVVGSGHAEGTYVQYHNGYYYLFWNTGGCCSGAASTYTIHVARSASPSGPYTGARVFDSSSAGIHGPGQIGIITQGGQDYFSYHYYPDNGGSVLGLGKLGWVSGWPVQG